jgi:hypothetical protein
MARKYGHRLTLEEPLRWGTSPSHRRLNWGNRCTMLLSALLSVAPLSSAAATMPPASRQRLVEFRKTYSITNLRMGDLGVPKDVDGALSTGLSQGSPAEQVYSLLEKNKDVFRMADPRSELKLIRDRRDSLTRGRDLSFQQLYRGLEVRSGELTFHLAAGDQIRGITASYFPDISISDQPVITRESAVSTAMGYHDRVGTPTKVYEVGLIVLPFQKHYYLAWRIRLGIWEDYIDAQDGKVLFSLPVTRYTSQATEDVHGSQNSTLPQEADPQGLQQDVETPSGTPGGSSLFKANDPLNDSTAMEQFVPVHVYPPSMMRPVIDSATGDTVWIDPDGRRNIRVIMPKDQGSNRRGTTGSPHPRSS